MSSAEQKCYFEELGKPNSDGPQWLPYYLFPQRMKHLKAHANNVLLWLCISAVSCERKATAELTLDVNAHGVGQ